MLRKYIVILIFLLMHFNINAQQLSLDWAKRFGFEKWDYASLIENITDDKFIIAGSTVYIDSNSTQDVAQGNKDAWFAICDTNGSIIKETRLLGNKFETILSASKLGEKNLIIGGVYQDTMYLDSTLLISDSNSNAFVCTIDDMGVVDSVQSIGGKAIVPSIFVCSAKDSFYVLGNFIGEFSFDNLNFTNENEHGIFIIKNLYENSSSLIIKATGECLATGFACNDSLLIIGGIFNDTITINDSIITNKGNSESAFLAVIDLDFQLQWFKTFSSISNITLKDIDISNNGIAVMGEYEYSLLVDQQILNAFGNKDIYIITYDLKGDLLWCNTLGNVGNDYGNALKIDDDEGLLITGTFLRKLTYKRVDGNQYEMNNNNNIGNSFLLRFNNKGMVTTEYKIPGNSDNYINDLIFDSGDGLFLTGNFSGGLSLPSKTDSIFITSLGEKDIFLLKYTDICKDFSIYIADDTIVCEGQTTYLPPHPLYSVWIPNGLPNNGLEVTQPGIYKLFVTNNEGCIAVDSLKVNLKTSPQIYAGNDIYITPAETVVINSGIGENYDFLEWRSSGTGYFDNPNNLSANYFLSYADLNLGSIQLELSVMNICGMTTDSVMINVVTEEESIYIFPNPTMNIANFVAQEQITISNVIVTNQFGRIIDSMEVNNSSFIYDVSEYPSVYFHFYINTNIGTILRTVYKIH